MAFAATVVWEVRPSSGNSANGGGFDATSGTPGTDYSQQDSPQVTYTDLVIDGTTNTDCTSAANPFTAAHVGNIINITGGTGFTVQRVQIMSVAAGVARMDKSLGTLGSTGGNGRLGGALASLADAVIAVAGNTIHVKAGTDTFGSTVTLPNGSAALPITVQGYHTTRGDLSSGSWSSTHVAAGFLDTTNFPHINVNSKSFNIGGWNRLHALRIDGLPSAGIGCYAGGSAGTQSWYRCKIATTGGQILTSSYSLMVFVDCDLSATGGTSSSVLIDIIYASLIACRITSAAGNGIGPTYQSHAIGCVFYDFAASTYAFSTASALSIVSNCTFVNCAGYAVVAKNNAGARLCAFNNHITGCGTAFYNAYQATSLLPSMFVNNRLRDNTTDYSGFSEPAFANITTDSDDATEYVGATGTPKDFHLTTVSAGLGAGLMPYMDTGAFQSKAAGSTVIVIED